ncbi:MAG: LTA synthase family protein [Proteobacteria bacterium]|nr:LTA synthase family protein [Pseudomonadota bacterium]
MYEFNRPNEVDIASKVSEISLVNLDAPAEKRNIFYIVMDRYADQRTLTAEYNFDNSNFIKTLRDHGFFVADSSVANYPFTYQSLSSSMNMVYHNNAVDQIVENRDDIVPYIRLIEENYLTKILKAQGYKYVHMGSWWAPTESSPLADENFQTTFLGRIELRFFRRSILEPLLFLFHDDTAKHSIDPNQCDRVPRKLARLKELGSSDQPTFVFAHFLVPHDPFVFDKDGNCKNAEVTSASSLEQNYLGQLQYANSLLSELLESLLSQPGPKPIIIIQADEGPYPARFRQNEDEFQWISASEAEMKQKMRILNAYFFPGTDNKMFYDTLTPVNSFRLLLNTYFGANLQLLPDLSFAIPNNEDKYGFFEVTDTVQ